MGASRAPTLRARVPAVPAGGEAVQGWRAPLPAATTRAPPVAMATAANRGGADPVALSLAPHRRAGAARPATPGIRPSPKWSGALGRIPAQAIHRWQRVP